MIQISITKKFLSFLKKYGDFRLFTIIRDHIIAVQTDLFLNFQHDSTANKKSNQVWKIKSAVFSIIKKYSLDK